MLPKDVLYKTLVNIQESLFFKQTNKKIKKKRKKEENK